MFHQLTLGGAQRSERIANTNQLTPGGNSLKIEGVSKIFPGRVTTGGC